MHFVQNIESGFLQLLPAALMASLLHLGNRNYLFLKMTNISHVAGFAIASTHNSGLTMDIHPSSIILERVFTIYQYFGFCSSNVSS